MSSEVATVVRSAQPKSRAVTFDKIRNGLCRWPSGDPRTLESFTFCGEACSPDHSYCVAHQELAYIPSKARTGSSMTAFRRAA